jgi:tetratricopeptide (TPR) repeat protein
VGLGDALRFQGWHDAAADAYRRALELLGERRNSTWENAAVGLGEALIALKDPAAEELLQNVVAHDARNVSAWLALGRFHYEAEDWAESERSCREALKIDQTSAQAQAGVAAALAGQKRYPEAEAAFRLARQRLGSERGEAWEHATRGLAHALASQGKNSEASRLLRELAAPGPAAAAQALLDQAAEHRRRAEWPDAEKRYREALSLDASNVQARIDLGDVLSYQNRRSEAADEYRSALQLLGRERGPAWEQATLGLANALAAQDQHDDALRLLYELLEANPQSHAAHFRLGDVYREQQQWPEAERALRRATELNPADPGGHVFLGTVLVRLDRPAEAEAEFRVALERLGESRGYHWDRAAVGLALALAAQDKVEQAISELQQLAEGAPSVFAGQYLLVRYHGARRDWPALAESEVALAEVAPNEDGSTIHTMHAAAAFVLAEDEDGYREACRVMLEKYGRSTNPAHADRTVKACCLSRRFDGDVAAVLRLADVAVTDQEQHSWYVYFTLARALAALRAGEWNDALRWSRVTRDRSQNFTITAAPARLVEALAQRRLGHPDEAREALAAAIEMRRRNAASAQDPFESGWGEWLLFDALHADVEVMLQEQ